MKDLKAITALIGQMKANVSRLEESRAQVVETMGALETAGMEEASLYFNQRGYLYLNFPMGKDGSRVRRYVGNNPERVAEARAKVERFAQFKSLEVVLAQVDSALMSVRMQLSDTDRTLSRALTNVSSSNVDQLEAAVRMELARITQANSEQQAKGSKK